MFKLIKILISLILTVLFVATVMSWTDNYNEYIPNWFEEKIDQTKERIYSYFKKEKEEVKDKIKEETKEVIIKSTQQLKDSSEEKIKEGTKDGEEGIKSFFKNLFSNE